MRSIRRAAGVVMAVALAVVVCQPVTRMRAAGREEVELQPGASARLGATDRTVVFEAVESDGRCPTGVTCVWEGDAVVRISIGSANDTRTILKLHTSGDAGREAEHGGFVVRLIALTPYPSSDRRIDPRDYRARLRLTATP